MKASPLLALTALAVLGLTSCGSPASDEGKEEVEVFAAASLSLVGADLEATFEAENPGVDISFNYAGSSKLVQQMQEGANPDMLITADASTMTQAQENLPDLKNSSTRIIAQNSLVLASADGNPAGISAVADLEKDGVVTAICAAEVPCGKLANAALDQEKVRPAVLSEEANVTAVATKLAAGEADAAFIYTTDAASLTAQGQKITVIDLPNLEANDYPLVLTSHGEDNQTAQKFANWLAESEAASTILTEQGFKRP